MNKILEREKIVIDSSKEVYLTKNNVDIEIINNSNVKIYHFVNDSSIDINIYLNSDFSSVKYYFSTINYNNNIDIINIYHNANNTTSNVINHGVNVLNNKLDFNISGYIPKKLHNVVCNQDNQIFNVLEGNSTILPKLYIDSEDVDANHSAYIGSFSKELIFYMKSRGLSDSKINDILIKSFLIPSNIDESKIEDFLKEINKI